MINVKDIRTEKELTEILSHCGFASKSPTNTQSWQYFCLLHPLSPARQLTEQGVTTMIVGMEDGRLKLFTGIMQTCEFDGTISEAILKEGVFQSAMPDRPPVTPEDCLCLLRPLPFDHYHVDRFVGIDETLGRFGEVNIKHCRHCGRIWLHYFVEYEHYSRSGRYFMGVISPESTQNITPENAVSVLESLDWHLYGGSFFGKSGKSSSKHLQVD